jgi:hypothetical protein
MPAGPAPVGKVLRYKSEESMGVWEYGSMGVCTVSLSGQFQFIIEKRLEQPSCRKK